MKGNYTKYKYRIIIAVLSIIALLIKFHPWTSFYTGSKKSINNEYYLSGAVIDAVNNMNISQAEIAVVGRNEQYITESNGNFRIPFRDSLAHVRVRISKKGYISYDKSYDFPSPDIIIQLNHK